MSDSIDVFVIGSCLRFFTIRVYEEANWGWRKLGPGRHALDFWRVSLVFENYQPKKENHQ